MLHNFSVIARTKFWLIYLGYIVVQVIADRDYAVGEQVNCVQYFNVLFFSIFHLKLSLGFEFWQWYMTISVKYEEINLS